MVGRTLLLTVWGAGCTAGSSCPTSSPAEIMELRLSNRHSVLEVPGPVEPSLCAGCPGVLPGLEGWLTGEGCGLVQVAGCLSSLLAKGSGNSKKFSLLGGGPREVSCSSGIVLRADSTFKRNPVQLTTTHLGLVLLGALSSAVWKEGSSVLGWWCGLGGLTVKPLFESRCLSRPAAYAQIPLQIKSPFLCEPVSGFALVLTAEQQLRAGPLQLLSDLILILD